ncbi:autotransporter outer membrane beta-barrel domain-containing protein [Acidicapsa ligni]|uniref:hypothetical protein n=1 Tax=Acidicapsa ligni TaxID=542300 RepID=UPI0021DF9B33|nr:hypothetical protein [Acidicapsa ligni]
MKMIIKSAIATGVALIALSANAHAQGITSANVAFKGLGSSGIALELGLGASSATLGSIHATCIWSGAGLIAKDATAPFTASTPATDSGNAWAAWTPAGGTCAAPGTGTAIYSYLTTDSVVGNRCLFDGTACSITNFPTTDPASAGQFSGLVTEVPLPTEIANALNSAAINAAGTDIRPEDAEFATARALTPCGSVIAGTQYLGLGYSKTDVTHAQVTTAVTGSSSVFNVINFTLPAFTVTPVGATPIIVVVNGSSTTGLGQFSNITSAALAKFLDGTFSYSDQVTSPTSTSGDRVYVGIREPLSGTYNTMEYNVPNTTVNMTSQDVGVNQNATNGTLAQRACTANGTGTVALNPLNITTASTGARIRTIGTGQELSFVRSNGVVGGINNNIGYGFWSVANFSGFSSTNGKYLMVDSIDPLLNSSSSYTAYNGAIPLNSTTELANVDLHAMNAVNGYPIWSLLRLVSKGTTVPSAVTTLASAAQSFVTFDTTTARPDFIVPSSLTVVRSHFLPPAGSGLPPVASIADGHVGLNSSSCSALEAGGDVGGVVLRLSGTGSPTSDNSYCANTSNPHHLDGQTGMRR